jgi:glycosyltransferase involved in cell wall biosynthesis
VIDDGHSGLLISPGDVESLSGAIIDLLEDPQKARYLAQNGYKRVRDHFSAKRMAEQYVEVYKDVLRARQQKS